MADTVHQSCIDACHECANACDHCAVACLAEPQPKVLARCIELDIECAQACRFAIAMLARGSAYDRAACALTAVLCDAASFRLLRKLPKSGDALCSYPYATAFDQR